MLTFFSRQNSLLCIGMYGGDGSLFGYRWPINHMLWIFVSVFILFCWKINISFTLYGLRAKKWKFSFLRQDNISCARSAPVFTNLQLYLIMCNTKLCRPCVDNVQEGGRSTARRLIIVVLYSLLLKYHISLNSKVISSRSSHALGVKWSLTLIAVKHSS